ncbi:MAG: Uma2 family endonuclease [Microscillaceae bacterium]|nr:Uma2 family endonuclease [Microscillaceae bacterium]
MLEVAEKVFTVEEYFELEKQSEIRHEFVRGNLIPIPGESKIANQIVGNCYLSFRTQLKSSLYQVYFEDIRLVIHPGEIYRYPDLVVAPKSDNTDTHAVTQPHLIIEVLSESTENQDRGKKMQEYLSLKSLQYYLLISQNEYRIECYSRQVNTWEYQFYTQLTENLHLDFFPLQLSLQNVYEDIQWEG